jgi:hypothetical protein
LLYWRRCCGFLHTWVGKQCKHFFGKPCLFVSILLEYLLTIFSCSNRMQCIFLAQGFTVFKRLFFVFFWIIETPTNQHSVGEIDVNRKHLGSLSCTLRLWLFFLYAGHFNVRLFFWNSLIANLVQWYREFGALFKNRSVGILLFVQTLANFSIQLISRRYIGVSIRRLFPAVHLFRTRNWNDKFESF